MNIREGPMWRWCHTLLSCVDSGFKWFYQCKMAPHHRRSKTSGTVNLLQFKRKVESLNTTICYQTRLTVDGNHQNEIYQPQFKTGSRKVLFLTNLQPNSKFLIVKHENNWDSLTCPRTNCPWKDKRASECFGWDQAKFKREMLLSARALGLCWDTLLGVHVVGWTPSVEAQERTSSRPNDDGAFPFDLLMYNCAVLFIITNQTWF